MPMPNYKTFGKMIDRALRALISASTPLPSTITTA
jgi:hypothetical protein